MAASGDGSYRRTVKRRRFLAAGGSAVAALTTGCSGLIPSQPGSTPAPDSDEWRAKPSVDGSVARGSEGTIIVEEHGFAVAGDDARVTGRVQNTDAEPQPVTVEVELFRGSDGPAVAEKEAERDSLEPGEAWAFAVVFGSVAAPEVTRYTIETD